MSDVIGNYQTKALKTKSLRNYRHWGRSLKYEKCSLRLVASPFSLILWHFGYLFVHMRWLVSAHSCWSTSTELFPFPNVVTFSGSATIFGALGSESCNIFAINKVFVFLSPQVIFNEQKTSVPGDLISVPGATEKISFLNRIQAAAIFQDESGNGRRVVMDHQPVCKVLRSKCRLFAVGGRLNRTHQGGTMN